ncbi:MAG TPA: enoyl-CoA hydratase-related protein [Candidatus Limnocylindrales bacterium]|nr:enoyl-CoA hydratase-related protein [Candidatus Limnocylindrales bacterium]
MSTTEPQPPSEPPRRPEAQPEPALGAAGAEAGRPHRLRLELPAEGPDRTFAGVALITLDRPAVLNALDFETMLQLTEALERFDADPACRCIVITGAGQRAFAAGADIGELAEASPTDLVASDVFSRWERIRRIHTPIVAAVQGYALGGGCELAMACDIVVAAEDAVFGQPEIRLGIIPGAGGTQRLTRALGKARAMDLILTGAELPAREALARGLVSRLVPSEETVPAALELAARIAAQPPLAVRAAKASIDRAFELSLEAGLEFERREFYLLFASEDQAEGMQAFVAKRAPEWKGR